MPKEEWGKKRICPITGKRFYDLNKSPIVSPYTGEVVTPETGKGGRTLVADKADKRARPEVEAEEDDLVLEEEDETEVDLGDDVLEDDEDDDVSLDDIADVSTNDED